METSLKFLLSVFLGILFFVTLCFSVFISELKPKDKNALYWLSGIVTVLIFGGILLTLVLK